MKDKKHILLTSMLIVFLLVVVIGMVQGVNDQTSRISRYQVRSSSFNASDNMTAPVYLYPNGTNILDGIGGGGGATFTGGNISGNIQINTDHPEFFLNSSGGNESHLHFHNDDGEVFSINIMANGDMEFVNLANGVIFTLKADGEIELGGKLSAENNDITAVKDLTVTNTISLERGTPASTGTYIGRVIGGSSGARLGSELEAFIVQLYPSDSWNDGLAHSAANIYLDVPEGATFIPWAVSAVTVMNSTSGANEGVAYWGRCQSINGSPCWGSALEVTNEYGGNSGPSNLIGQEILIMPQGSPGAIRGLDLIIKGDNTTASQAIIIRSDRDDNGWGIGIEINVPAEAMWFNETDAPGTASEGLYRIIVDDNNWRIDLNTANDRNFNTFNSPFMLAADTSLYLGGVNGIGETNYTAHIRANGTGVEIIGNSSFVGLCLDKLNSTTWRFASC